MSIHTHDAGQPAPAVGSPRRTVALTLGCLLLLPGVLAFLAGGGMTAAHAFNRDDAGFFSTTISGLQTSTAALVDQDLPLTVDSGTPVGVLDALDTEVTLAASGAADGRPLFVGIAPASDVENYLGAVAHEQVISIQNDRASMTPRTGSSSATIPMEQTFWAARSAGSGRQSLTWPVESGRWAVVVMNADGTSGVDAGTLTAGIRSGLFLPVALSLLGMGLLVCAGAIGLIALGAGNRDHDQVLGSAPLRATGSPVVLTARLDEPLSRWMWLVKWFLAIPHLLVLALLWPAFLAVTIVAGVSILFTGRYPRTLFFFNVGVLRWSWRVSYYAAGGGIGTDRYPPFTLDSAPGYPATFDIDYPERLSRGLVLVKWWLLAIPQYFVVGLLVNGWWGWTSTGGDAFRVDPLGGGLLGLLVLIAGIILLVSGSYPRPLFDLIVGFNRWTYRVIAYAALMTDAYPPFRLDAGGVETVPGSDDGPERKPQAEVPVPVAGKA